mgnify:CR=1 FL=1
MHVECLMWAGVVVLREPLVDDDLGLLRCREPLGIQNLPTQRPIETLIVSVLPRTARQWFACKP